MPNYQRPFFLTGHFGRALSDMTIQKLCRAWRLPGCSATTLRTLIASDTSIVICSERSGAGKTLLLEALLASLPERSTPIFLRGRFERFAFLADRTALGHSCVLVANEISPHEEVYLWGAPARRVLALASCDWRLWATAHASSAQGLVSSWIDGGLLVATSDLPERLVVISILTDETFTARSLTFETMVGGVLVNRQRW